MFDIVEKQFITFIYGLSLEWKRKYAWNAWNELEKKFEWEYLFSMIISSDIFPSEGLLMKIYIHALQCMLSNRKQD